MKNMTQWAVTVAAVVFLGGCKHVTELPETPGTPNPAGRLLQEADPSYQSFGIARSDYNAGLVFVAAPKKDGRIEFKERLCSNLYGHDLQKMSFDGDEIPADLSVGDLFLPDYEVRDATDLNFSVNLLENIIGEGNSAKLNLSDQKTVRELKVDWGRLISVTYDATANSLPVPDSCFRAIEMRKNDESFTDEIWVLTETAMATGFTYDFSGTSVGGPSGELKLKDIIELDAKRTWDYKGDASLVIPKRVSVGYRNAVPITRWQPTGQTSGGAKVVAVEIGQALNSSQIDF